MNENVKEVDIKDKLQKEQTFSTCEQRGEWEKKKKNKTNN